jgi:hypothetical protein
VLVAAAVLLWQGIGQQHLGIPQFGAIILAEGVWLVWLGVSLIRVRGSSPA